MIEGHAHTMEGTLWRNVYVGWFDRMDPDGKVWDGVKTIEGVLERLSEADKLLDDPVKGRAQIHEKDAARPASHVEVLDEGAADVRRKVGAASGAASKLRVQVNGIERWYHFPSADGVALLAENIRNHEPSVGHAVVVWSSSLVHLGL